MSKRNVVIEIKQKVNIAFTKEYRKWSKYNSYNNVKSAKEALITLNKKDKVFKYRLRPQ